MKKWLTNSMDTIASVVKKCDSMTHRYVVCVVAQWSEAQRLQANDALNPFGRCDRGNLRWHSNGCTIHANEYTADSAEVSIDMSKESVDNDSFGVDATVNGSVMRETSKENGMVSTCIFRDDNPEAWIEITFQHNDAEMRHFRY